MSAVTTPGSRKAALLLLSLHPADRKALLGRLPAAAQVSVKAAMDALQSLQWPLESLADAVLADDVRGLAPPKAGDMERIVGLADRMPPAWFARALAAWPAIERDHCLALLPSGYASEVAREWSALAPLPATVTEALRQELAARCAGGARA